MEEPLPIGRLFFRSLEDFCVYDSGQYFICIKIKRSNCKQNI